MKNVSVTTLQQRRNSATRRHRARVVILMALIGGVSYAAWFAPWAKRAQTVQIEIGNGTVK